MPVALPRYDDAIARMVERLERYPGVLAIYQVGGVSTPGISDIDLLVVFDEGAGFHDDPRQGLDSIDGYLFTHNLFGTARTFFARSFRFGFFHDFRLLTGQDLMGGVLEREEVSRVEVDRQSGLEYLLKLFISQRLELTHGVLKVRGMFLHAKALLHDLTYIEGEEGRVRAMLETALGWRTRWFDEQPKKHEITDWLNEFHHELKSLLDNELRRRPLFVPRDADLHIARNITLAPSGTLGSSVRGCGLPALFGHFGRRYLSVQNRLRHFQFGIPMADDDTTGPLRERYRFIREATAYCDRYLPHFQPVAYGMNIFRVAAH